MAGIATPTIMANLIRSAKSGGDWTLSQLDSYNIHLEGQKPLEFFGVPVLPDPAVDPELLQHLEADNMQQDRNAKLIHLLDLARRRVTSGESAVIDFAVELLKRTRYEDELVEDREPLDARAQLVAGALATFTENNASRESSELPPLDSRVMPGIVMVDTAPTFFKIPVTQELVTHWHVRHGTYPPTPTVVTYCFPPVSRPARRSSDGMKPLDNRRQILSCYEAFKAIVGI